MAIVMGPVARAQLGAMAQMRWRVLVNQLRTRRGKFELGATLFHTGFFLLIGLAVGFGLGFAAWHFAAGNHLGMLSLLLWPVFLAWQLYPVALTSFQENVDLSVLLRFPVSFRSYTLLYLFVGLFDLSSLLGGVALLGIWVGTVLARPHLAGWMLLALVLFAAFNLLLTRMIFAWIDRWLAQRKTREIIGAVLLFLFLGLQWLNPAFHQNARHSSSTWQSAILQAEQAADWAQKPSPPALTARSIEMAAEGHTLQAATSLSGLVLYAIGAGILLSLRLRKEYRGESLGEAPAGANQATLDRNRAMRNRTRRRWLPDLGPIGAVVGKEFRYLSRSGTLLYSVVAPLFLLFIFGGSSRAGHNYAFQYAFPLGVAYGFLGLTRLIGNSLGGEGAGIQLYFLSPTPFRRVMFGKNLFQILLFCVELAFVCAIVQLRFGMPGHLLITATFCWLLFALPVQLAVGNVLSIAMAYRMTLTRMSREQGAIGNGLSSLLIQLLVFAIGAGVFFSLTGMGHAELVAPVFLVMAMFAALAWLRVLALVDRMATDRREALVAVLVRAT